MLIVATLGSRELRHSPPAVTWHAREGLTTMFVQINFSARSQVRLNQWAKLSFSVMPVLSFMVELPFSPDHTPVSPSRNVIREIPDCHFGCTPHLNYADCNHADFR
jgi:hypothetical protein